jgi:HEAT repeat protein
MSLTAEQLLEAALALPGQDCRERVEPLAAPLQRADRAPCDPSWGAAVPQRSPELTSGEVVAVRRPKGGTMTRLLLLAVVGLGNTGPAHAYIDAAPTLGLLINNADRIGLLRVDQVSRAKRVIIYQKVADLKGTLPAGPIKHKITDGQHPREPRLILDWAQPGQTVVYFEAGKVSLTCLGPVWYESSAGQAPWWIMNRRRAELSQAYFGSVTRLRKHVAAILAGREVVLSAVRHQAPESQGHEALVFKDRLLGPKIPLCRVKASLRRATYMDRTTNNPDFLVGPGAGSPQDVPELLQGLKDADRLVRLDAALDLGLIGPPAKAAAPALREALNDPDYSVRLRAAASLPRVDPEDAAALPALLEALKDPDAQVRRLAATAVGDLGPLAADAVPTLAEALQDPEADVRWAAAEALGHLGTTAEAAVPALVEALKDGTVRAIAADALGGIGEGAEAAVPALTALLRADDETLRLTAATALVRIEAPAAEEAAPLFLRALKSSDAMTRRNAEWCLQRLELPARVTVPALTALLREPDANVRYSAVLGLGGYGPGARAAVPALTRALEDGDVRVRQAAARALAQTGIEDSPAAQAATRVLLELMRSPDPLVRENTEWFLNQFHPKAKVAVPALASLLQDKSADVRAGALRALARIGAEARGAIPAITQALGDEDDKVRRAAARALTLVRGEPADQEPSNGSATLWRQWWVAGLVLAAGGVLAFLAKPWWLKRRTAPAETGAGGAPTLSTAEKTSSPAPPGGQPEKQGC